MREDPILGDVPVLLTSSSYIQDADRRLAERVGASRLITRAPDLAELIAALPDCIDEGPPEYEPSPDLDAEHARRVSRQLERQALENVELSQKSMLQSVELSVLGGISGVLMRNAHQQEVVDDVLGRCLEVAGLSAAVAFIGDGVRHRPYIARAGSTDQVAALERRLEGIAAEQLDALGGSIELPPDEPAHAGVAVPLSGGSKRLGVLALSWSDPQLGEQRGVFARTIAGQLGEAIALQHAIEELSSSHEETIYRLVRAAEFRDDDTARHTERVSLFSKLLSERLQLGPHRTELVRIASALHDVGKIGVSDTILLKPGPLTSAEYAQMKLHTEFGYRILSGSGVELLDIAALIALTHHEHVDGKGYPRGLLADEIPIEGRLVAIADVFDALTSARVYRPPMTVEDAMAEMLAVRGSHLDAELLDYFVSSLDDVLAIRDHNRDQDRADRVAQDRAREIASEELKVNAKEDAERRADEAAQRNANGDADPNTAEAGKLPPLAATS